MDCEVDLLHHHGLAGVRWVGDREELLGGGDELTLPGGAGILAPESLEVDGANVAAASLAAEHPIDLQVGADLRHIVIDITAPKLAVVLHALGQPLHHEGLVGDLHGPAVLLDPVRALGLEGGHQQGSKEGHFEHVDRIDNIINLGRTGMSIQKYLGKLRGLELLSQAEVRELCSTATRVLLQEPNVIQTSGPQYIIGDIHGQFHDLRNLIDNIIPEMGQKKYVFLGDYVDRGYNSIETICLLLCYKCLYPASIVLLRGNHETSSLTKIYGFYDEVIKKYGNSEAWKSVTQVFQYLPLAAVIQESIVCIHGGLSPNIPFIDTIALIDRVREIPENGPMSDLVWSDPDANLTTWAISNRGAGYLFPHQAVKEFMFLNDVKTVARAHQLVEEGFIFNFGDESLVTVWSAPNYCYRCGNQASVMKISEDGSHQFIKFHPSDDTIKLNISYEYVLPYFL